MTRNYEVKKLTGEFVDGRPYEARCYITEHDVEVEMVDPYRGDRQTMLSRGDCKVDYSRDDRWRIVAKRLVEEVDMKRRWMKSRWKKLELRRIESARRVSILEGAVKELESIEKKLLDEQSGGFIGALKTQCQLTPVRSELKELKAEIDSEDERLWLRVAMMPPVDLLKKGPEMHPYKTKRNVWVVAGRKEHFFGEEKCDRICFKGTLDYADLAKIGVRCSPDVDAIGVEPYEYHEIDVGKFNEYLEDRKDVRRIALSAHIKMFPDARWYVLVSK